MEAALGGDVEQVVAARRHHGGRLGLGLRERVGQRRGARLEHADVDRARARAALERHGGVAALGRGEAAGDDVLVGGVDDGVLAHAAAGEGLPHDLEVLAAEAHPVRSEHGVPGVEHRGVALLEQERVEDQLDPAAVAGAVLRGDRGGVVRALGALELERLVLVRVLLVPLLHQRLADLPLGAAPDLAVGVDLDTGGVVAVVGVVQRVLVDREVADRGLLVARGVHTDGEDVAAVLVAVAELVLSGGQVAPRLAHRATLLGADALVRASDHPVGDGVGVFVADDAHVQRTVGAGRVERSGGRLEEVLVGDAGDAVLQGDLVGVVAAGGDTGGLEDRAGQGAGLHVADLGVGGDTAAAEVVELQVVVRLGEAEVVAVVVHPVVRDEQVAGHEVDVVAARHQVGRVALRLVPGVGELTGVGAGGGDRRLQQAARGERAGPGLVGVGVVADRRHRGDTGHVELVPGEGRGHVAEGPGGHGAVVGVDPAADDVVARGLADLGRGHRRVGREVAPGRVEADATTSAGGAGVAGRHQQAVGAHDRRGAVEGADLGAVDAGLERLGGGPGDDLGAGEQVPGVEQLVLGAEELHDHVVDGQGQGRGGEGRGEVVGELERVLRAALGVAEGALVDLVDLVVLDLVGAVQDVAGDGVDHEGVGEREAVLVVDDVGLVDRADGAVGHREGPQPDLLLLGEAGDGQAGPGGDRADGAVDDGADLLQRRVGDGPADVAGGLDPALQRGQRRGRSRLRRTDQGGGDVGDLAAGDTDGHHRAQGGGEVAEALAEEHGVPGRGGGAALRVGVVGELLLVHQLQAGHRRAGQAEQGGVVLEVRAGGGDRVLGGRAGQGTVGGQQRGGGAEVVPAQRDRAEAVGGAALGGGGQHAAAQVEVGQAGDRVAEGGDQAVDDVLEVGGGDRR